MPQAEQVKQSEQHEPQLIRVAEVCRLAGLSKSSIWRLMAEGRFPEPTRLGPQCTRWNKPEILSWVEARLAERNAPSAQVQP